jgi:outer membrane receptor protein involved in Fe transport
MYGCTVINGRPSTRPPASVNPAPRSIPSVAASTAPSARLAGRAGQAHRSALCQRPEPAVLREHGGKQEIFPPKAPAYTQVDLDAKLSLDKVSPIFNNRTFLQLNVINVFDETYVGGFSGTLNSQSTTPTDHLCPDQPAAHDHGFDQLRLLILRDQPKHKGPPSPHGWRRVFA